MARCRGNRTYAVECDFVATVGDHSARLLLAFRTFSPMPDDPPSRIVRGACPHDCPDTCALLTTVEDGRAVEIRGAPDHPPTGGRAVHEGRPLPRSYLFRPARAASDERVGKKGEGRFERITWDEALDTIAEKFGAIAASPDGPQAIVPYSYAGTMGLLQFGSMDRRFFHRLGASLLDRTICATAGKAGWARGRSAPRSAPMSSSSRTAS